MSKTLERDKRHVWHPFTQHASERDPVVVARAKNASLFDETGNELLESAEEGGKFHFYMKKA